MINNKTFWKTMKPFFTEKSCNNEKIILVEGDRIISQNEEVAETFNNFFTNAVKSLNIKGYINDIEESNDKGNFIEKSVRNS